MKSLFARFLLIPCSGIFLPFSILFIFVFSLPDYSEAQDASEILQKKIYQAKKEANWIDYARLTDSLKVLEKIKYPKGRPAITHSVPGGGNNQIMSVGCWVNRDASFQICPFSFGTAPDYRNDDGSTPVINLPFNFCFYGTNETSTFINNNGNISFVTNYGAFTATGFPSNMYSMVAPFWADVDTQNPLSGLVYYQLTATHLIVQWDSVGYFGSMADKRNTFQLIITDGTDPIIPGGNNVAFCYKDMQWTTGAASGGVGGFGGTPATVGANRGDGISYIQFGRFDHTGNSFSGAYSVTPASGIDYLDNETFIFNTCGTTNIPPTVQGLDPYGNDTLTLCAGDTAYMSVKFFSSDPPPQVTTATATSSTLTNFSIIANVPGNTDSITIRITPHPSDIGFHAIIFSGTDNGTPPLTTSDTLIVHVITSTTVDAGPNVSICPGDSAQLQAISTATGYSWSPTTGLSNPSISNPKASPAVTTTYHCQATTNGMCPGTDSVTVVIGVGFAEAGPNVTVCAGQHTTLNASGGTTYSWSPTSGLSNASIANPVATLNSSATYTVTVSSSCLSATDTVHITVNPLPAAFTGPDVSLCNGSTVTLGGSSVSGHSYSWSPTTSLSSSTSSSPNANPVTTITYTLTETINGTGCQKSNAVLVTVNQLPAATTGSNVTLCAGNSATLGSSSVAGHSYSWIPTTGLSSGSVSNPVATPGSTTTYSLTETIQATGCQKINSVIVTVHPLPIADAGIDITLCAGQQTTLNASGGVSYNWVPSSGLSDSHIATPVADAVSDVAYIVTVTTIHNCSKNDTVLLTVLSLPTADAGSDSSICFGDTTHLLASGGTGYVWSPVSGLSSSIVSNPLAFPADTTLYTVVVTGSNGCHASDSVRVIVHPLPPANAGPDLWMCPGSTIQLSASGGISYVWDHGNFLNDSTLQNPSVTLTDTAQLIVLVTDIFLCKKQDTVLVVVNPVVPVNAGADAAICYGDTLILGSTPTAPPGSTYGWTPTAGLNDILLANPGASPALLTNYIVYVTNDTCHGHDTIVVSVNSLPAPVNAGNDTTICFGQTVLIGTDSVNGNSYHWTSLPAGFNSINAQPNVNPGSSTTYVMVQNIISTGCLARDTMTVSVNSLPLISAGTDTSFCIGAWLDLGSDSVPGINYSWTSSPTGFSSNAATPFVLPGSTTHYFLTGINPVTTCMSQDTLVVGIFPLPVVSVSPDVSVCAGQSTTLIASGGSSYQWSPSSGLNSVTSSSPAATPSSPTQYIVLVTDTNSCQQSDSVFVGLFPQAIANAGADQTICKGTETTLSGRGGKDYAWSPSTSLSSLNGQTVSVIPTADTDYFLEISDTNGCSATDAVHVVLMNLPSAQFSSDSTSGSRPFGVQFINSSSGASDYLWLFGDGDTSRATNPYHFYTEQGTFTVSLVAISPEGCRDTTELKYIRVDNNTVIVIPNVFTPNGDFANDLLMIESKGFTQLDGEIFNRWGVLVAKVNFMKSGWNGLMTNGDEVSAGTYFYTLNGVGLDGKPRQFNGFVEVFR